MDRTALPNGLHQFLIDRHCFVGQTLVGLTQGARGHLEAENRAKKLGGFGVGHAQPVLHIRRYCPGVGAPRHPGCARRCGGLCGMTRAKTPLAARTIAAFGNVTGMDRLRQGDVALHMIVGFPVSQRPAAVGTAIKGYGDRFEFGLSRGLAPQEVPLAGLAARFALFVPGRLVACEGSRLALVLLKLLLQPLHALLQEAILGFKRVRKLSERIQLGPRPATIWTSFFVPHSCKPG